MYKKKLLSLVCLALSSVLLLGNLPPNSVYAEKLEKAQEISEMVSSEKEFLLNRFIVKYKESASEQAIDGSLKKNGGYAVNSLKAKERWNYRTVMVEGVGQEVISLSNKDESLSDAEREQKVSELESKLYEYSLDPNVEYAQPVYVYHPTAWGRASDQDTPADYNGTNHWYYDKANVREMWQDQDCYNSGASCGGDSTVVVAVIDTGVAVEDRNSNLYDESTQFDFDIAPEFNISGSFNLYNNSDETSCTDGDDDDSNGYIDDCRGYNPYEEWICAIYAPYMNYLWGDPLCTASEWSEAGHPNDDFGHGTFVSGSVASNIDNTSANPPGSSVSPAHNITLMPIKGSERITHAAYPDIYGPSFYNDDLCNAIDYARLNGADVINMSLGGGGYDSFLEGCINDAYNAGIVLVAASGNDSTDVTMYSVSYPAAYTNVIAVGASDSSDDRASYSNGGSNLDLVAAVGDSSDPGNSAWQQSFACFVNYPFDCHDDPVNNYKSFSAQYGAGTSYASPQVAAAAAIVKSKNPTATPYNVKAFLTGTATDIGATGKDNSTGYGIVNFEELWYNVWTNWGQNGSSSSNIEMVSFNPGGGERLYQAVKGLDGVSILTRYTTDGSSWSSWTIKGSTYGDIAMTVFNPGSGDRLYQAVRGLDGTSILTRYTTDGENWSTWTINGSTYGNITMLTFNPGAGDRLYQAVRGLDGTSILTRYTTDGSNWSTWTIKGSTTGDISMGVFDPGSGDRLYQAVRGLNGVSILTRYTTDGENWSTWTLNGSTYGNITMTVFNPGSNRLYQAVRGLDGRSILTRYTTDGSNWSSWVINGSTYGNITMTAFSGRLYQAVRGMDNTTVYTRSSTDGNTWGYWMEGGSSSTDVTMTVFNSTLYQAMRGTDGRINTRNKYN
ncbi:S8 family serine peptidase [Candidatus Dojkabacteria bacterium]|nr:S8 family serine peptidase [Candidatus Dojkabacteria bacterium]